MTFADYVRRERGVEVSWEPAREVLSVRIQRRDGRVRVVAATELELVTYRGGPIELFRFLVRDDPLDQAAISLLARLDIRRALSIPHGRDGEVTLAQMWEALDRVRRAGDRAAAGLGSMAEQVGRIGPEIDRPAPLAPPNPDLPFYRFR